MEKPELQAVIDKVLALDREMQALDQLHRQELSQRRQTGDASIPAYRDARLKELDQLLRSTVWNVKQESMASVQAIDAKTQAATEKMKQVLSERGLTIVANLAAEIEAADLG